MVKADFKRLEKLGNTGQQDKKRGTIYLIQSGSSHIMGQVDIVDCIELTKKIFIDGSLEGYKSVWKMRG